MTRLVLGSKTKLNIM